MQVYLALAKTSLKLLTKRECYSGSRLLFFLGHYIRPKKIIVMLPSATDRKNVKTRVAFLFFLFFCFLNALNIKKLSVFEGKCKNTNK